MEVQHQESRVQKELECAICLKQFVSPRCLPCLHTFCSSPCLESLCKNKKEGDKVSCPICRKEAVVPKDGLFPLNFFAQNIAQIFPTDQTMAAPIPKCHECEDDAKDNEAVQKSISEGSPAQVMQAKQQWEQTEHQVKTIMENSALKVLEDEYVEFIAGEGAMKTLGSVHGETMTAADVRIEVKQRKGQQVVVQIVANEQNKADVGRVKVEWKTAKQEKKEVKMTRENSQVGKVEVEAMEDGVMEVTVKGKHVQNSPMTITHVEALWDEQKKHNKIKIEENGKLAVCTWGSFYTAEVKHEFGGNEEWFCQVSLVQLYHFLFGVVETDVDPQQVDIYNTQKAALIYTNNHTAFGMGLSNAVLNERTQHKWKEGDKLGAYYCQGKLSFYANGQHVGNYPQQLNTTKQYRFAGVLHMSDTKVRMDMIQKSP